MGAGLPLLLAFTANSSAMRMAVMLIAWLYDIPKNDNPLRW